jgi:hypothetical protein
MEIVLSVVILLVTSLGHARADTAVSPLRSSWVLYEVHHGQTLWEFARHLGVTEAQVHLFLQHLKNQNPQLENLDRIEPGDKILFLESTLNEFVAKRTQYRTYWLHSVDEARTLASLQQVQYQAEGSDLASIQPRFHYSRIDAEQRGQSGSATLLSTLSFGALGQYSWNNRWGPGALGLEINWTEYSENIGQNIDRNQIMTFALDYQQGIEFTEFWTLFFKMGLYQSPFLFTDVGDQLFLKVGTQPGTAIVVQRAFPRWRLALTGQVQFLFAGFAGDTIIDQGLTYSLGISKEISLFSSPSVLHFLGQQKQLLSSVTAQTITDLTFGVSFTF